MIAGTLVRVALVAACALAGAALAPAPATGALVGAMLGILAATA